MDKLQADLDPSALLRSGRRAATGKRHSLSMAWQSYTLPEHFQGLPSSSTTHYSNTSGLDL